jgi:hypothetical protein
MLGESVEVWLKHILYFKLILACQEVLDWVWPSMNQNRLLFVQIQILPPSMHQKRKESIDIVCKTTNRNSYGNNSQRKVPLTWRIALMSQKKQLVNRHLRWATLLNNNIRSQTSHSVNQKFAFHNVIQLIKRVRASNLGDENRIWTFRYIASDYTTGENTSINVMSMMRRIFN